MFSAFVTMVSATPPVWLGVRSDRAPMARTVSVLVVPPFMPMIPPAGTSAAAACAIRCFSGGWRPDLKRSGSVRRAVRDGAPVRAREQLLLGEGLEIAADGRLGRAEPGRGRVDVQLRILGEQLEDRIQP